MVKIYQRTKWICGFLILFVFGACATPVHKRLEKLQPGMDKTQVLDLAGTPKRTARQDNGDLWTFEYYIGNQHFERDVHFNEGHVALIFAAREINAPPSQDDAVIRDYERLVKESKEKRKSSSN